MPVDFVRVWSHWGIIKYFVGLLRHFLGLLGSVTIGSRNSIRNKHFKCCLSFFSCVISIFNVFRIFFGFLKPLKFKSFCNTLMDNILPVLIFSFFFWENIFRLSFFNSVSSSQNNKYKCLWNFIAFLEIRRFFSFCHTVILKIEEALEQILEAHHIL